MTAFTVIFGVILLLAVAWAAKGMRDDRRAGIPWQAYPPGADVGSLADSPGPSHEAHSHGGCDSGSHDPGGFDSGCDGGFDGGHHG